MTSGWRETWSRVSHMSWDELHTRVGQEVSKRLDLATYRAGLTRANGLLRGLDSALSKFLFSADDLPHRVALMREHLRPEAEDTLREADQICEHRFDLLGYADLDYGREIDWHLDAVHGKRAPLLPWFKIDFLNFAAVGDHKVTWELNRHQHLVTLAKAWCLSGEKRYIKELTVQWYSWQRTNPYPIGINWASSLEVAFRSLSWIWILHLLEGCPEIPASFETDLLHGLAHNGRYIGRYLSTYFSPNTHLLGEAVALFFIGTLCPQIPSAGRWKANGWRIVLREAERQVRPDGVYFEQSLYYHVYALDLLLYARILAACNQIEIPGNFDRILGKMLDVLQALSQAGPPEGFGDDDGGRLFNPRRNRTKHMTDSLALGAVLFGRNDLNSASLTEESVWLFGDEAVSHFDMHSSISQESESKAFESGGIYVIADSEPCLQQMMIDAGPQGTGRSGHGHADALSIRFSQDGRRCLVDPGTYCYLSDGNERSLFRGTGAHNTLRVDGLDQAVEVGPFAWSSIPAIQAEQWLKGETFSLFVGSHTGYCRLQDPVLHRRFVVHLAGGYWLVRDVAQGRESHQLEIFWHFASDFTVRNVVGGFVAEPSTDSQSGRLALMPAPVPSWNLDLALGHVSPAYGTKERAPVLRLSSRTQLPAECAILIVSLGSLDKPGKFTAVQEQGPSAPSSVRAYRYDEARNTHHMIFSDRDGAWHLGPWTSDAKFLYCRMEGGRVVQLIACGGTFVRLNGASVIAHDRKIDRFEWLEQRGLTRVSFSDDGAASCFAEEPLKSGKASF